MSIDPKVATRWPEPFRTMWIGARMARAARRDRKHLHLRGGMHREWRDHLSPVG